MENKTSKYLKYAIGEIILVAIGILMALQINNWNENVKKNNLKRSYITSLIDDFTKDTIQLNSRITYNNLASENLDSMSQFFYSETATHQDFINLFNTFNRTIRVTNTYNTNSFKVLISSGNIDLLDKKLVEGLMELNRLQNGQLEVSDGNMDMYIDLMNNMAKEYPIYSDNTRISESTKALQWKSANLEKVPVNMTNIINFKQYVLSRYLDLSNDVKAKTEEVLALLNLRLKQ
jgi:hypothetical protein